MQAEPTPKGDIRELRGDREPKGLLRTSPAPCAAMFSVCKNSRDKLGILIIKLLMSLELKKVWGCFSLAR